MSTDPSRPPSGRRPLLDPLAFKDRLSGEVARLRRAGGFLSLGLFKSGSAPDGEGRLAQLADRLQASVRLQDVLARLGSSLALLMPDTTLLEAQQAAKRLLGVVWKDIPEGPGRVESAGLATAYGEVEGGVEALLAAAEEALRSAKPGETITSSWLQGRPQVLVVDDNGSFARALCESLFERGWEGHPCTQSPDAFQRVQEGNYHALFIDLVLRGATGVEVLRRAVAANPRRPTVLMSGYDADHEMLMGALELGPVIFLRKPFSAAELDSALQMFRGLLPGTRHRPPTAR